MTVITIVGSGQMGSAMSCPAQDTEIVTSTISTPFIQFKARNRLSFSSISNPSVPPGFMILSGSKCRFRAR